MIAALLLGLSALGWSVWVDVSGWNSLRATAIFLVWLTAASAAILGVLWNLSSRGGLRWISAISLVVFCAAMQWGLEVGFEKARVTLAFMPLMLAVLAAAALSWKIAPGWISRSAPWLALAGIAFAGCSAAMRAHQRRALDREIEVLKTQSTANDRSLRGLDRAAWLLGREFSYQEDWEIDVSLLHEGDGALRKAVDDWVATLENQVRRETTGN